MELPDPPPHPSLISKDPSLIKSVDERVSFDRESEQWIFEDTESEYQYNFILQKWLPVKRNQVIEDDGDVVSNRDVEIDENKDDIKRAKRQKLEEIKKPQATTTKVNTGIFISNLPEDVTTNELEETFGKFGLISEDFKTGDKRIKLYYDDNSKFKGEAFIIFYNKESVDLAIQMQDDTSFRGKVIKVEPARFDPKLNGDTTNPTSNAQSGTKKSLTLEEKKLLQSKTQAMKQKLADWGEGEAEISSNSTLPKADFIRRKIWDKTVVIENMFRLAELQSDPTLELEIKQDIQEECDKLGIGNEITKIFVHDISKSVTVKFSNAESSEKCIAGFGGRYFDGLKLSVKKYSGEKLSHSKSNESNSERIEKFGDWLEDGPKS
ncbi:cold sensitive U2 snRNA suppressor 2 [[Candida] railenensis]|uniref:Cold sensitive U2 snRNA suppressor 2 n=1 Tax=[Candida] railenensis TaxID=45579 RepID=A0A9P0VV86_9ASCO|nr:cold sensitive U2 snRNA suppressor 2 [[Candida] railenensis]